MRLFFFKSPSDESTCTCRLSEIFVIIVGDGKKQIQAAVNVKR